MDLRRLELLLELSRLGSMREVADSLHVTTSTVSQQIAGLSREAALEFSFFLSIPTMFVATGYDLLKTIRPHAGTEAIAPLAPL